MNVKGLKERQIGHEPLFLRYLNKELSTVDLLNIFTRSSDPLTAETATEALNSDSFPDMEKFRLELKEAVYDIIKEGLGEEFKAFVNHYMEPALIEDIDNQKAQFGENVSRTARIKDPDAEWLPAFLCYNLCLYIKAFGLESLKSCRVCFKLFSHKGKYAVYCSDPCKNAGRHQQKKEPLL